MCVVFPLSREGRVGGIWTGGKKKGEGKEGVLLCGRLFLGGWGNATCDEHGIGIEADLAGCDFCGLGARGMIGRRRRTARPMIRWERGFGRVSPCFPSFFPTLPLFLSF